MASYTYKGTKITGTSTTAKTFPKSDVKNAHVNDTYLNTAKGHVYTCTTAGKPSAAKWRYTRTDPVKKPDKAVGSLGAPKRTTSGSNTRLMEAAWKVPDNLKNAKSGKKATGIKVEWTLDCTGKIDAKKRIKGNLYQLLEYGSTSKEASTLNLANFTIGSKTYKRNSFYPLTTRPLHKVGIKVVPTNAKGDGPIASAVRTFTEPRKPTISAPEFNATNGTVSATVTTNEGTDYKERYDTKYKVTVTNSMISEKAVIDQDAATTNTEHTLSYDADTYGELTHDQYIKVVFEAFARGYAGDSATAKQTYYVSYPVKPLITKVKVEGDKCTVYLDIAEVTAHPVDGVRLEYLADVAYEKAEDIPSTAVWTSTDIVDDQECTALAIDKTNLIPDRGAHTWVRVKAWHASEERLCLYSDALEVTDLYRPAATAADEEVKILNTQAGKDGKSIEVLLGWNADGQDDATGTELTWSEQDDTWKSTEDPDEYSFTWLDGEITYEGTTYYDSAKIVIKRLQEETLYYIRARRYTDTDGAMTFSDYSNTAICKTAEIPDSIVATCDSYVPEKASLPVYWTLSSRSMQTAWRIVSGDTIIMEGEDNAGAAQISAERLEKCATDGIITFHVEASTGGEFIASEDHEVTIVARPVLSISTAASLTAQPFSFDAEASVDSDLIVIVTSQGITGQYPEGTLTQVAGDTVYSGIFAPAWEEDEETLTAEITLPGGLDFRNLGQYTLSVTAVDRETRLTSDPAEATFAVGWANPAVDPFNAVTLTTIDETDENGVHHIAVQIDLTPPTGSASTDVYDIYRLTGDGAQLIGEGFPLTCTTTDEYAPFGEDLDLNYRIALRTVDGDEAFADIEYDADGDYLRLDWDSYYLELPYNISIADSYRKDVEIRQHMDGSTDGYWNRNVTRSGKLSTDVIRLEQSQDIALARNLARYPGAVFVRTPDGSAYEADVQISDMSTGNKYITAIAIDATEIGLTAEFMLPTPFVADEED